MGVGSRILAVSLLALTSLRGADRGGWAVENPALAAGHRMSVALESPLQKLVATGIPRARAAFTPAHWLAVLYDWMPDDQFKLQEAQFRDDLAAGYVWLPASEWRVPCPPPADVKVFLNSVLLAKGRLQRPTQTAEAAGQLCRYHIRSWNLPETGSLLQGSPAVGFMSFTTARLPAALPPAGEVDLWVQFELFGGIYSVDQADAHATIPLTYTPYVHFLYGSPPDSTL